MTHVDVSLLCMLEVLDINTYIVVPVVRSKNIKSTILLFSCSGTSPLTTLLTLTLTSIGNSGTV